MVQNEILSHIYEILDETNYTVWSQSMLSFLKGRKLSLYVTWDIPKQTKVTTKTDDIFLTRLIDWDNKHDQILIWFHNTTIPPFATLFDSFDDAQGAWDMLTSHYSSVDGSREYRLIIDLYLRKQEPN
jgi:hypothetical protein